MSQQLERVLIKKLIFYLECFLDQKFKIRSKVLATRIARMDVRSVLVVFARALFQRKIRTLYNAMKRLKKLSKEFVLKFNLGHG